MKKLALAALPLFIVSCRSAPNITTEEIVDSIVKGQTSLLRQAMREDPTGKYEDDGKYNLLQMAVESRNREAAALLLLRGANPNGSRKHWDSPLLFAVMEGDVQMARLLLSFRADPNFLSPLANINRKKNGAEMVALLKEFKADPDIEPRTGLCMLTSAVLKGEWYVRALLEMGANPDGAGNSWTPIEAARLRRNEKVVKLLIEYGANDRQVPRKDPTEYDPVKDVRALLLSKGARHGH